MTVSMAARYQRSASVRAKLDRVRALLSAAASKLLSGINPTGLNSTHTLLTYMSRNAIQAFVL